MGYSEALEAAGCKVLQYKEFGSWQGSWLAFVEYTGEKGIVEGSYGSCSGCDAFQAEFGYRDRPFEHCGKYFSDYGEEISEEKYNELEQEYQMRLAEFGERYLVGGLYSRAYYESELLRLTADDWFDQESREMCEWVLSLDF